MKGLVIKDLRLAIQRRQTLLIYLIISVIMGMSLDAGFVIAYMTMLMGIISSGTISYDEYDNGFPFLFSLPVDCKTYVAEKFIFTLLMEVFGRIYGTAVMFILGLVTGKPIETEGLAAVLLMTVCIISIMCFAMIFIQLKYGSEKARTVMFIIYGVVAAIALAVKGFAEKLGPRISSFVAALDKINPWVIAGCLAAITAVVCYVIYLATVKMMDKKEF